MSEESAKAGPHIDETMIELHGPVRDWYVLSDLAGVPCGCSGLRYADGVRDERWCETHARERYMRGAK